MSALAKKNTLAFVEDFISALKRRWPKALLQFEDFAINHATPLLESYRDELCCFNDDIQGTAGVTAASLLAAARAAGKSIEEMNIAFLGAGSGRVWYCRAIDSSDGGARGQ